MIKIRLIEVRAPSARFGRGGSEPQTRREGGGGTQCPVGSGAPTKCTTRSQPSLSTPLWRGALRLSWFFPAQSRIRTNRRPTFPFLEGDRENRHGHGTDSQRLDPPMRLHLLARQRCDLPDDHREAGR